MDITSDDHNLILEAFYNAKNVQKFLANHKVKQAKDKYKKIVSDSNLFFKIESRDDAKELSEKFQDITIFSRVVGVPLKGIKMHLISKVMSDEEFIKLYTEDGLSAKDMLLKIDMPFITVDDIKRKVKFLGISHTEEQTFTNRSKASIEYVHNDERVKKAKQKAVKTNLDKYGVRYALSLPDTKNKSKKTILARYGVEYASQIPEAKTKRINTFKINRSKGLHTNVLEVKEPLICVSEDRVRYLLENQCELVDFLKEKFPDVQTYSFQFLSSALGVNYSTLVPRIDRSIIPVDRRSGKEHEIIRYFLITLGYKEGVDFITNDRTAIKPQEIDFYFPKQKVGIEVNDLWTHNSSYSPFGKEPKPKNYHMEKSKLAKEKGIRLIHAWEHYLYDENKLSVLKNAIKHALGISKYRVYARNTYVKEVPNTSLKDFFNKNNIQGFRGAKTAYALFDKNTDEVLMAYSVGNPHFSHQKYDLELIRGASKLDTTIVGGASKLWKYIIDNNPEVNSIVYYIDRNIYNGSSISTLEGNLELVSTQVGFWNYFVDTKEMKNRQPKHHKEIKELVEQGKVWEVYNAGTETYVWTRGTA